MSIQIVEIAQPSVIDTVAVAQPSTVAVVEIRQGPAGTGGGGSVAWDDITGTASDVPFLPVAAPAHSEGLVFYDSTDKSLSYYNDEADVTMNIGREMWLRVRNNSGAAILNGKVVYINDAIGQLPTIRLARADDAITSRVIGIATHDIGNNEFGYVTTTGEVKGLDTNAFDDGDLLFLSAVTAGEMTLTAPLAPNRVIQVATVIHAHPTQGKLYCHPETDSIPSTGIVDSTATGRALITAASASAARTTLELGTAATENTGTTSGTIPLYGVSDELTAFSFATTEGAGFSAGGLTFPGTGFTGTLVIGSNTANRSATLPDASGTIALTSRTDGQPDKLTGGTIGGSTTFATGTTFTYGTGAASAHRFALNGGAATGDALFTAASPAAARTTLELGSTNTPTFGGLDLLTSTTTTLNVYNSLSGANFERLSFRWASNIARIGTAKGGTGTARDFVLETDGTERMRVLSTGSVGIGTATPGGRLHVSGPDFPVALFERASAAFNAPVATCVLKGTSSVDMADGYGPFFTFQIRDTANTDNSIADFGAVRTGADNSGSLVFRTYTAGTATEKVRIIPSGNVGIGTPTPASKLTVTGGDIEVTGAANGLILKTPDGTKQYRVTINNLGELTTTLFTPP